MRSISSWWLALLAVAPLLAQGPGPDVARRLGAASEALAAGNGRAAALILEQLVQDKADLGVAWYQLAMARRMLQRDADAFKAAERAVLLLPDAVDAKVLLAELCVSSDPGRASQLAGAVLAAGDDVALLRRLLPVLVAADDPRAGAAFDRLLGPLPTDLPLLELKVQWALGRQDLPVAIDALERLVALEPQNPLPLQGLARAQQAAGKAAAAAGTFERLLAVNPSNLEARAALIALLRELQREPALILQHERALAFYRQQVQRWQQQGRDDARPTGSPPARPPK